MTMAQWSDSENYVKLTLEMGGGGESAETTGGGGDAAETAGGGGESADTAGGGGDAERPGGGGDRIVAGEQATGLVDAQPTSSESPFAATLLQVVLNTVHKLSGC